MERNNNSSLPRLFAITVILITIIAGSVGVAIFYDLKKDRIRDLHYSISVIKRYYELGFEQWGNALVNFGNRMESFSGDDRDSLRNEFAQMTSKTYDELIAIGLVAPNGQILISSSKSRADSLGNLLLKKESRRSFIKAREADFISLGEAYYYEPVQDWLIPLRVPIRNAQDEVVSVATTGFRYEVLINELNSFGFDPNYNLILINDDFNTIQFYHPFAKAGYDKVIGHDGAIFSKADSSWIGDIPYYSARNTFAKIDVFALNTRLENLNHSLYAVMPSNLVWDDAIPYFLVVFIIYISLIAFTGVLYRKASVKEREYLSHLVVSEANLTSLFESTSSIIALFNKNKRIIEFNSAFSKYAEITEDLTITKGMDILEKLKNREAAEKFIEWQDRALSGEKFKETTTYQLPDGTNLYFQFSYSPIYQDGKITGLSMFADNVTELKTYQTKLEELVESRTKELVVKNKELEETLENLQNTQQRLIASEKMASLGLMAAGIGHEVNNPLNFIKNGAAALKSMMEDNETNFEEYRPFLDIINDGVKRANSIVSSLSHFSRQVKTMDEACNLNSIIENCLTIVHSKVKDRIMIKKQLMNDCPIIQGNEGRLHQAVLNFINNAQQAISEKGTIEIETKQEGNYLVVNIKDDGEGILPENLEKIADPFYTTKNPGEGTGLGLFISYSIVEEHNGKVTVKSKRKEGTTFTLKFQLEN